MRQAIWALVVLGALVAGFVGGRVLSSEQEALIEIQKRLTALETQLGESGALASSSKLQRIAVVQVNELALRYQESNPAVAEQLKRELDQLQPELKRLEEQVKRGEISSREATRKALELQQAAQKQILVILAGPIQAAINQVARERDYDIVMKREDVILYYDEGEAVLEDITEQVWTRLQAAR